MKDKINILVCPSDRTGVSKFRSIDPHVNLEENYPDEFHVNIVYEPKLKDEEWLSKFDLVHFHRQLGPYEEIKETIDRLNKLNIPTVMDIDDYWTPDENHPVYGLIKKHEIDKKVVNNIKHANYVMTTTSIYAEEIGKFNKNVHVFPNAVDPKEKQFKPNPESSDRIRIGWLGGSCFTPDTEVLTDDGWKYFQDLEGEEKIATLNKESEEIEYHKPINYIKNKHEGKIYQCDNKNVSFSVTPNHNMYVYKKGGYILTQMKNLDGEENFHVKTTINKTAKINEKDIIKKEYNGYVYCVEVPNNIMYVRRNGKAFWCGNSHLKDLENLRGLPHKLKNDGLLDKVQFVVCGFDLRGTVTEIDKDGNEKKRDITPKESVWYEYEKIFTQNYDTVSKQYKDYLLSFTSDEYEGNIEDEPYRRVWTKPIKSYAKNYNLFDISLAPLVENKFNKMKSDLKAVEAGFHKKPLIAQDFGPYTLSLKNSYDKGGTINDEGNAFLVDSKKNHKDWYKYLKLLINNPEYIKELGERLHETVKEKYDLNKQAKERRDFYSSIIEK